MVLASSAMFGQAALIALIIGDKVATEKFNISMEAGGGLNSFSEITSDSKAGLALNFGIGCNIMLNENWYLNPTIYFLAKRSLRLEDASVIDNEFSSGFPATSDGMLTLNYIDFPLFINYRVNNSPWRVGIAPQISFSPKLTVEYEFSDNESFKRVDKDNVEPVVFGMLASVSYVVSTGRNGKGLTIALRYYQGMTDTYKNDYLLANSSSKGSYVGLNLSFPFITDELAEKNKKPDTN